MLSCLREDIAMALRRMRKRDVGVEKERGDAKDRREEKMRALLFAYAISMLSSSAPNSRRDNVLQLPTKNFAKKTKLDAFAMQRAHSVVRCTTLPMVNTHLRTNTEIAIRVSPVFSPCAL